jgi:hypothetical protein
MKELTDRSRYFLAIQPIYLPDLTQDCHDDSILFALNYIASKNGRLREGMIDEIKRLAEAGKRVYLDSGGFTLAHDYAKETGRSVGEVFMSNPSTLPFFEKWFGIYKEIVPKLAPYLWGYVEVDFGNYQERCETRQRSFDEAGIVPVPVFRAGFDPMSVLTDLLRKYDRICIAGTILLSSNQYSLVYNEVYKQWKEVNPDCYLHVLGLGAFGAFSQFNFPSCDSSTFSTDVRFGGTSGYCYTGISSAAVYTSKFAQDANRQPHESISMPIGGRLGILRHSIYNLGRKEHLRGVESLKSELNLTL